MNASARVLVDTSVWIDFFRKIEPWHAVVSKLIAEGRVCSSGIILAELMQGAKSEKELAVLRDFVHVFPFVPDSPRVWLAAGELSFSLRKKGKTVGLSDCLIAAVAREGEAELLTRDSHFDLIKEETELRFFVPAW